MKSQNSMKIVFESRSVNEGFARSALSAFAAQLDPTIDELCDIKTAVSEAVTNCIVHGYPDSLGKVYISAAIYEDRRLVIRVRDTGRGITDVKQAMEPLFTTGSGDERSGLGFSVMQSLMDKVSVRSKQGGPTTVTLEKKFSLKGEQDAGI